MVGVKGINTLSYIAGVLNTMYPAACGSAQKHHLVGASFGAKQLTIKHPSTESLRTSMSEALTGRQREISDMTIALR